MSIAHTPTGATPTDRSPASGRDDRPALVRPGPEPAAAVNGTGRPGDPGPAPGAFGPAHALTCRECGASYPIGARYACEECFGPLEVAYRYGPVTRAAIEAGPPSMWRYCALLPVAADPAARPTDLAAGWTRLHRADRLAAELGMRRLWVKDDSANPTHSFKDRVVAVAVAAAHSLGLRTVACASTGNLAGAVAAAAARSGLRSVVLIPSDLERSKTLAAAAYQGTLVAVRGSYDDVNRLCSELAFDRPDWGFVNVTLRPFYAEGSKTVGFEVAEQLRWRLPEQLVAPIASGSLLTKVDKAFRELTDLGLVPPTPCRVFGAQASGCSPVSDAYAAGTDVVQPVRPNTIAKSLAIGNPADGPYALDVVRRTGGAITDVSDPEIIDGIALLARTEGIFAETAGGVTIAVLRKLLRDGLADPDAETVVLNTGDGLKTLDALDSVLGPTAVIASSVDAFNDVIGATAGL